MTPGSTLLLSWENPDDIWMADAYSVQICRRMGPADSVPVTFFDVPWGAYEDTESCDPCARYSVTYLDSGANPIAVINDQHIKRTIKPAEICKIEFKFYTEDGFHWRNRIITIERVSSAEGSYSKRLVTNNKGVANAFIMPGVRMRIHPDGDQYALDVVIPQQNSIGWFDLICLGSRVPADRRATIGDF